MSKDLNTVQINDPKIGMYSIILNNDQLKEIGKSGAQVIETAGKPNIKEPPQRTSSGRITISPDSQTNHENGFIENDIDWSQFFPNEDNAKIPELLEKAKKWDDNFELALTALATFIGAGLGSYVSGNPTGFNNMPVDSIIGPFADFYAETNPEQPEELNKLLENLGAIRDTLNS